MDGDGRAGSQAHILKTLGMPGQSRRRWFSLHSLHGNLTLGGGVGRSPSSVVYGGTTVVFVAFFVFVTVPLFDFFFFDFFFFLLATWVLPLSEEGDVEVGVEGVGPP